MHRNNVEIKSNKVDVVVVVVDSRQQNDSPRKLCFDRQPASQTALLSVGRNRLNTAKLRQNTNKNNTSLQLSYLPTAKQDVSLIL